MTDKQLIRQIATQLGWTQADVQRAINASKDPVITEEEVLLCMLRYAGPDLKRRNYELGAQKRVSNQQKEMIRSLVEQLTTVQSFYVSQFSTFRTMIDTYAEYVADLLKQQASDNKQEGRNE
jgi:hypothetical protein